LRIRKKNGGWPRIVSWNEFDAIICRGINFFGFIRELVDEYVKSYSPPKTIKAKLHEREPEFDYTIYYDPTTGAFGFISGKQPPEGYGQAGAAAQT
jgi:hypothetical protein